MSGPTRSYFPCSTTEQSSCPAVLGRAWFGYGCYDTADLQDLVVNVFGYPADKLPGTLWPARRLQQVIPQKLVYNISTRRHERAPVFEKIGDTRTVIGIHNYGDVSGNTATRITEVVFADLEEWKTKAACSPAVGPKAR